MDLDASTEAGRLEALRRYRPDDMPAEHELAALVRVAATLAGVPTATLNLLDDAVQRNYATFGFEGGSCAREDSLCVVALRQRSSLHVADASQDVRFATSPWVDGRLDSIRLYASAPLMTEDGWMIGTLCVFDSEPRSLPAHVLAALEDLAGQAMALLERRRLVRRAEDALQAKSAYLAQLSHEIRTPMHAVLGLLDLVLDHELPAAAQSSAELARRSGRSLVSLVDDVLDLARGDAGRVVLRNRPFDPSAVVADVGEALRVLASRKGLQLLVQVQPGVPACVVGDPDRVRQVLVNLVGNAVKFSSSGQVQVVLKAEDPAPDDVRLVMTVRDTGEGIPAAELPGLFRPFAQGRSGRRHGGTGLGLSICAQIAEQMGGRLGVSSTLGAGSTFSFDVRLPLGAPPVTADVPAQGCAGLRVLVADDSEVNRMVAVGLLESLGATATAVDDGAAAVVQAATGAYDVVLLDHEMPGMDGPTAARAIRALPGAASRTPVYALTGRVGADDEQLCRDAGMDGVLGKPLDVDVLGRALGGLLQR